MNSFRILEINLNFYHCILLVPSSTVTTHKTKHSLLPDPTLYATINHHSHIRQPYLLPSPGPVHHSNFTPNKRWTKSASCSSSFMRHSSSKDSGSMKKERSSFKTADGQDGFLVHEFAPSPMNFSGRAHVYYKL